jgi:hypothetical protein
MRAKRFVSWLTASTLLTGMLVAPGQPAAATPDPADLAHGRPVSASSVNSQRTDVRPANVTDGDQDTYWEAPPSPSSGSESTSSSEPGSAISS